MRLKIAFLLAALCANLTFSAQTPAAQPTVQPHKIYRNPLLPERGMADPDVIRVNGNYFLYATSDTRGYEVFESDDLVHWERKGWAFEDSRGGAWAPDVFNNQRGDGKFYLYY